MITIHSRGDYRKTRNFIQRVLHHKAFEELDKYGQMGVDALERATPEDSGETAKSWGYRIVKTNGHMGIEWYNTNIDDQGAPVAILIQYGHATGTGGYVHGRDFINPAMRPIFDKIANDIWKKVIT